MKRLISLLLVFCLTLSIVPMFSVLPASAQTTDTMNDPFIYVPGQGTPILKDKRRPYEEKDNLYNRSTDFSDDFVKELLPKLVDPLKKGILKDDWSDYCDVLCEALEPYLSPLALDENGNEKGYVGYISEKNASKISGGYGIDSYYWMYDWRLSTEETADKLHRYVDAVKKANNCDKINIGLRCLGVNVFLSYVRKYGATDFNKVVLYSGGFYGFETIGAVFSGDISIDGRGVDRFVSTYFVGEKFNEEIFELLRSTVTVLAAMGIIDGVGYWVERAWNQMYKELIPRLLMMSYGTFPGFWSLVGGDYYEKARDLIFSGNEEKYKGIIEKIDDYYYNTYLHTDELMKKAAADGAKIHIIAKYGIASAPLNSEFADIQSDDMLSTYSSSYGATCAPLTRKFDYRYLKKAKANGTDKYIGADKQIDASTAYLPDHTWFLKNLEHRNMPDCINPLLISICNSETYMTVFDSEDFPQYLVVDDDATEMKPLTAENGNTHEKAKTNSFKAFFTSLKLIFRLLLDTIRGRLTK